MHKNKYPQNNFREVVPISSLSNDSHKFVYLEESRFDKNFLRMSDPSAV